MTTLYGLPEQVLFCSRCTISNQRPNSCVEHKNVAGAKKETIKFTDGVCSACIVSERKKHIDWAERERMFRDIADHHRKTDGSYDCLVAGSGGKDSFKQSHLLRYKYGLHPLTVTWAPQMPTDYGLRNFQAWVDDGFTNYRCTPNGKAHRLLTRLSLENLFHPFAPFVIGQKNLAPKMAAMFGIPLVIYGENEAEYGNPQEDTERSERDYSYFTGHDDEVFLGGVSVDELMKKHGLDRHDLNAYMPANPDDLRKIKLEVQYLGFFERWDPMETFYFCQERSPKWKVRPQRSMGTHTKYASFDCKIDDLHYWTTHVKFGIGRCTYDTCQEIRNGHITREEGVALVKRFDGEWPRLYERDIFEYLNVPGFLPLDRDGILSMSDRFRSEHLWSGRELRHKVWEQ